MEIRLSSADLDEYGNGCILSVISLGSDNIWKS